MVAIEYQGFEGTASDNWTFAATPTAYNTETAGDRLEVNGDDDVWNRIKKFTGDIDSPANGSFFWGMQDLDNPSVGSDITHTLDFNAIDISSYDNVTLQFQYASLGFDRPDRISYAIAYDNNTTWGTTTPLSKDTSGNWNAIAIDVPDSANFVRLRLQANQNGADDFAGWDDIRLTGDIIGPDTISPSKIALTPADNATDIDIATDLGIQFDEPIALGMGEIVLKQLADNSTVETFDVSSSSQVSVSGDTVTIDPSSNLDNGTEYAIEIDSGAIEDLADNDYDGFTGDSVWNFTTEPAVTSTLFISEYVEGSSNNKALEFYNPTGSPIDLNGTDDYTVEFSFNGGTQTRTIDLTGTIAAGETYVLADADANAAILNVANQTDPGFFFNGNDAILLQKNGIVVDAIGQVGFDPGSEWGTGNTSTQDSTLRRNSGTTSGDTNPSDVFDPSVEWNGFPQDTFDDLGNFGSRIDTPPQVVSTTPSDGSMEVVKTSDININFDENVATTGDWFAISGSASGAIAAVASGSGSSFTIDPDTSFIAGETISVTLDSSQITDEDGTANLLDGNGDGIAGDNFNFSFDVVETRIVPVANQPPKNTVPSEPITEFIFSDTIDIRDPDNSMLSVMLATENGTVTLAQTSELNFTEGDGSKDETLAFSGSIAAINSALDGLTFIPAVDFSGDASLEIVSTDPAGNSDTDSVAIAVNNPNADPPENNIPENPVSIPANTPVVGDSGNTVDLPVDRCSLETLRRPFPSLNETTTMLTGTPATDIITATENSETIAVFGSRDRVLGLRGDDNILGHDDRDTLAGNQGTDYLDGDAGNDLIFGGRDADAIRGNIGDDIIAANLGRDRVRGDAGNDLIFGNQNRDRLDSGDGDDRVYGGKGDDLIGGGNGNDRLAGDRDNDCIYGEAGDDTLYGGNGDDTLIGGGGDDILYGEAGDDIFVLDANHRNTIIADFTPGRDRLQLSGDLTVDRLTIATLDNATQIQFQGQVLATLPGTFGDRVDIENFLE